MKERLIGACILVALAVIFIPMFFEGPDPGGMITRDVDLPGPSSTVRSYQMSLTRNTPPEPISPLVAAGKAPADAKTGRIERAAPPAAHHVDPAVNQPAALATTTTRTVPVERPARKQPEPAAKDTPAAPAPDNGAAEDRVAALSGWFVQAGSFANPDNAERLTARLKDKGFSAFMLPASSGGKTVYRVRIGPLEARRAAEKLAPTVAAASGSPTEVVSNP